MTKTHLKYVYLESSVQQLEEILKSGHSAFPVMNTRDNMVGMIKARFIVVLLKNKVWSDVSSESQFVNKSMHSFYSPQLNRSNNTYNDSSPLKDFNKFGV